MSRGLFLIADHQKKHAIKLAQELITAVLFACALQFAHLPAAWFFGPLVASAFFALRDWQAVELPRTVCVAAQAVIGCALGAGFSPGTLLTLPKHFAIFAFAVVFILLTSLLNGWLLTRRTRLDVATAFLGTMPGGAGEMAAMGDSLRADSRLVVIMQYARLLLILASLALVTPFLSHHSSPPRVQVEVTTAVLPAIFVCWKIGALCLLAFIGWLTGMPTRIPAGTFLVPTVLYFFLEISGFNWAVGLGRSLPLPILSWDFRSGDAFAPQPLQRSRAYCFQFVGRRCCYWPGPSSWRGF